MSYEENLKAVLNENKTKPGYTPGNEHQAVDKWPATKQDIIKAAESDGAPKARLAALARLPKDSYADASTLIADLAKI
ncbi:DUF2795 domain-containing protein [Streptomyces sp. RerS4]|uniref:DUF2795 domain-containing protein n=1 Tax=Streptomyces sp. RerS4 TaxID=2942449 RepID=UPI00201BD8B8|nr:DUF2795 domain-containing protein [Streptomyces sp. RerS4]UQX04557.1 DUF2795 domain-containing protein [Streptomyces sp. RerS4]